MNEPVFLNCSVWRRGISVGTNSCDLSSFGSQNGAHYCGGIRRVNRFLTEIIEETGRFSILSKDVGVPVVAFSLKDKRFEHDEYEISDNLRKFGWIVPAYTMAPDAQHITLLRVVVREDFSRAQAEQLAQNIEMVLQELEAHHPKIMDVGQEIITEDDNVEARGNYKEGYQKRRGGRGRHSDTGDKTKGIC